MPRLVFVVVFLLAHAAVLLPLILAVALRVAHHALRDDRPVFAADTAYRGFVERYGSAGHYAYVLYDDLIVGVLVVILVALGTHVTGYVDHFAVDAGRARVVCQRAYELLGILALMFESYSRLRIFHFPGCYGQLLA